MNVSEILWPRVGAIPVDDGLEKDLEKIKKATWSKERKVFLEEIRRLRDIESVRRSSSESKSQIYLAALLALIPILVSLTEHDALEGVTDFSKWYQIIAFVLFIAGIAYGVGAFVSSFSALSVRSFHRVDVEELVLIGEDADPVVRLAKEILRTVRLDRSNVNLKISHVIVTHKLIFRMALSLLLALLSLTFGPKLDVFLQWVRSAITC